jgi:hypothetical protein
MRFITVIFTVYIMLLAIVPCHCDTANGDCSETKLVSEITADNHTTYKYVDLCTPFCLSSGCVHAPIFFLPCSHVVFNKTAVAIDKMFVYQGETPVGYHGTFWHPPVM